MTDSQLRQVIIDEFDPNFIGSNVGIALDRNVADLSAHQQVRGTSLVGGAETYRAATNIPCRMASMG